MPSSLVQTDSGSSLYLHNLRTDLNPRIGTRSEYDTLQHYGSMPTVRHLFTIIITVIATALFMLSRDRLLVGQSMIFNPLCKAMHRSNRSWRFLFPRTPPIPERCTPRPSERSVSPMKKQTEQQLDSSPQAPLHKPPTNRDAPLIR
jgi:hypothetical protein